MTIFVAAGCACALAPSIAAAQTVPVTIDSKAPALEKGDKGTHTAALGFTNLTAKPIALTVQPAKVEQGCTLQPDPAQLPATEHTDVTVKIPAACTVATNGISFTVSSTKPASNFPVTAAPKPESTPTPEWGALLAFPIALVACAVAAFVLLGVSSVAVTWRTPLNHLDAGWDFKDSWVTNVTAVGALIAGLFGSSEVVRALIGKDADSAVALATVGAAAALFFVGAGPIIVLATKTKQGNFTSVFGLLLGSAVTLAGAFGELWVVYRSALKLDLGGWEDRIVILAAALALLLIVYAFRTIRATLVEGLPPAAPRTVLRAKTAIEGLAFQGIQTNEIEDAMRRALPEYDAIEPGVVEDYPRPRRSAVL